MKIYTSHSKNHDISKSLDNLNLRTLQKKYQVPLILLKKLNNAWIGLIGDKSQSTNRVISERLDNLRDVEQ